MVDPTDGRRRGRWRVASPLPPPGQLRTLALATLANTVGLGLWLTGSALYLTRVVGLSPSAVGAGLTVAGLVGLTASVPLGGLADRYDPRTLRAALQLLQAAVAAAYLLVDSFPVFLTVAVLDALLVSGNLTVRAALVAAVGGPEGRVHAFATLRAVANLGTALGAGLAGFALATDTRTAYHLLVLGNVTTYLVSAALVMRLPALPPARVSVAAPRAGRALRDGPFLAVSGASAVLSLHWVVLTLVVPLWAVDRAGAPPVTVSAILLVNTLLTVLLAVPLSRGARSAPPAARTMRRAGLVLAAAMLLYATTVGTPTGPAVALLLVATAVYTVGDLWHGTAGAALAYDLAEPAAIGAYQGVDGLVAGLARAAGPALLTWVVLDGGGVGWLGLAAVFAGVGLLVPALTRWALRARSPAATDAVAVATHQSSSL
ncbi:MFS transporter [Micromonospora krabiensis]|uniref:Nitrate/nitrite transporter NarK n=1 Tax=Micromonospora krabiensis TaxID=307121 RepID=A0A1C3N2G9_9ACTN|nr:MFS transporter [Micromonospora krabiensis]SBV26758.1 Nitrate/nitrite transporter NarK [Micromonospora krabiensis]